MCRADVKPEVVKPEVVEPLAEILRDIAKALDPDHPERVVIGPVDFGGGRPETVLTIKRKQCLLRT